MIIPMKKDIFNELNKEQQRAVQSINGPSVILAGAGSGKTRVLTYKVLNLIENHNVDPKQIMMVTFTNKAASEMKVRVKKNLGFIGTFHSFCVKVLRQNGAEMGVLPNFIIYDGGDQEDIIKDIIKNLDLPKKYSPSYILNRISYAKNQLVDENNYERLFNDYSKDIVSQVYRQYQKKLEKNNALDFDDLIFKTVLLFIRNEKILANYQNIFRYIFVDEYQDTNHAQYTLTKLLAKKYSNITVVGDFSQSIYSWRGAEIKNLEKFKDNFPKAKTFYLEENYRSTQNILDFAHDVISKNQTHPILKLFTSNVSGQDVIVNRLENEQYEALYVASEAEKLGRSNNYDYNSIAILYRINAQSRVIEEAFLHLGIPYVLIGGTRFYERREIKDIISYIRLVVNPNDEVSLKRTIKIGKKRFDLFKKAYSELKDSKNDIKTAEIIDKILQITHYAELYDKNDEEDVSRLENIKELRSVALNYPVINEFLEQIALVESEYSESEKRKKDGRGVYMMTLHQAKGLEFPYVFIVGLEEGILPHSRSIYDLYNLEEERRLFYVGITRAREKLYITHTQKRFFFGKRSTSQISRFLEDSESYDNQSYTEPF